jgi:hypothetical protein
MWMLIAVAGWWLHHPATRETVTRHPFMWLLTAGSIFADMTSKLMVSHACDQKYRPNLMLTLVFAGAPFFNLLRLQGYDPTPH